jgi:hypothetical protein
MAFQVSPGVLVKEVDLTNVVPAVATSIGAIAGAFEKGPINQIVPIGSEQELVQIFGKPNSSNFETWFTAANFLQYTNGLRVVRAATGTVNATANGAGLLITNEDFYIANYADGSGSVGNWASKSAGAWGNSIGVSICASAAQYQSTTVSVTDGAASAGATSITVDDGTEFQVGDIVHFQEADGTQYEITTIATNVLTVRVLDDTNGAGLKSTIADNTAIRRRWRFYDLFDTSPATSPWATDRGLTAAVDEMHVVVYDTTGAISGFDVDTAGQRTNAVLEIYAYLSKHPNAKTPQGSTNFYANVLNTGSSYIWWMDHPTTAADGSDGDGVDWGSAITSSSAVKTFDLGGTLPMTSALGGGTDDLAPTVGELALAYDLFRDPDTVDINLILAGSCPASTDGVTHATYMIDLAEYRKDCVAFISPRRADVVGVTTGAAQTANVETFFNLLASSSYAVFDSGYKYMYDKYADVYRFVPLNGDIAGLAANTDNVADPWFSPAGYNRGQVRGAVKLAYNPTKSQRDIIYAARINPVCTFPGQGTVLFGDKTALSRPSAFDRINVRRLFLVLEKAIATAAKFQLFEFNDAFTQAQFKNLVEPFLRDVQGRRGITDFSVVCDGTNNTGEVIDRNEFIGDIFIKPTRSINFITLNFVAVRTGVAFTEIGG